MSKCNAEPTDSGITHYTKCYCNQKQGGGYTYRDEYGKCAFCLGEFEEDVTICANEYNELRVCPDTTNE